jgi:hypothetical protein
MFVRFGLEEDGRKCLTGSFPSLGALRGVMIELISTPGKPEVLRDRCEAALCEGASQGSIKANFLKPFG